MYSHLWLLIIIKFLFYFIFLSISVHTKNSNTCSSPSGVQNGVYDVQGCVVGDKADQ